MQMATLWLHWISELFGLDATALDSLEFLCTLSAILMAIFYSPELSCFLWKLERG